MEKREQLRLTAKMREITNNCAESASVFIRLRTVVRQLRNRVRRGGSGCVASKIKSGRKRDMEMLDLSALRLITIKNNFFKKLYLMVGGVCACANRFGFFNGRNRT